MLTVETLRRLWPRADESLCAGIVETAAAVFAKYGIDTPSIVAIFMAQISHECGAGRELVENLNYSAKGLVRTWPHRFRSISEALPYAHHPREIANKVYDGRMGNRPGSDDGWLFRGRGGTNCTGHDGYYKLALKMAIDLLSDPDKVNAPSIFLECAVVDFILCGCLPYARQGNFRMVTLRLNGGLIGLAEREQWLKRWQVALAAEHGDASIVVPLPPPRPANLTQLGDSGYEVKALQQRLSEKGFACGADDGEFHEATRDAVNSFKALHGLPLDDKGTVDEPVRKALAEDPMPRPVGEGRATATAGDLRDRGSQTIASADRLGTVARSMKWLGFGTAGAAAGQQGGLIELDQLQNAVDKGQQAYGILQSIEALLRPLLTHGSTLVVALAIGGIGAFIAYEAEQIIARRVADHQSGAHMGR